MQVGLPKPVSFELKIKVQNDINVYLHRALPLCIALSDESMYPWFCERYVQIYSEHQMHKWGPGLSAAPEIGYRLAINNPGSLYGDGGWKERFFMDFLEPSLGNEVLQEIRMRDLYGADPDRILDFMVQKINMGYYLHVYLDECYLHNKNTDNQAPYIHPKLIYGYDHNKKTVLTVGFEYKDFLSFFTNTTFDYDTFEEAYRIAWQYVYSNPEYDTSLVTLLKPKELVGGYPFLPNRFLSALHDYITSTGDTSKLYLMKSKSLRLDAPVWRQEDIKDEVKFGMAVYDDLLVGLEGMLRGSNITAYNNIHLLFEHKKGILEKLNFIYSKIGLDTVSAGMLEAYQRIVKQFHVIKFKALRLEAESNSDIVKELLRLINKVRKEEQETLIRLYDHLAAQLERN